MYDFKLTAQELSDFHADMLELAGQELPPTEEELRLMAEWYGEE